MPAGEPPGVSPAVKSSRTPSGVTRATPPPPLVTHRLPSEPAAMSVGFASEASAGTAMPSGVMRPTLHLSVNQTLPSEPTASSSGLPPMTG